MVSLPDDFPERENVDAMILSIQRKLFPEEIQNWNPGSTRELMINTPVYIIFYRLNRLSQGVVLDNHRDYFEVRLKDWDTLMDIARDSDEVLLRIQWDNKGVYECLTCVREYHRLPFPLLQFYHHPLIHQERRRYIRYQIGIETCLYSCCEGDKEKNCIPSMIENISIGGSQFTSQQYIEEGIFLSIKLPFANQNMELPLKVISRRFDLDSKHYIYHTMFQGITIDESLQLEHFIKFYREDK